LIGEGIPQQTLEELLTSDQCSVDYNGYGYYVAVDDARLPIERKVFDGGPTKGTIVGKNAKGNMCGYIVFVQDGHLTLEIYPLLGDGLPPVFREEKVDARIVPEAGKL